MTPTKNQPGPVRKFWRASRHYDWAKVSLWVGVRNSIGVVVPLLVGAYLGHPAAGVVASVGAFNVAAADYIDSYWNRGRVSPCKRWTET